MKRWKVKGGKLLTVLIMSVLLTAPFTNLAEKIGGGYSDWWSNVLGAFGVMKADAATEIKPLQEGEIPSVYLEGTLPTKKTETVMRYTFESETQIFEAYNDQYFEKLARGELFSQGKTDRFGTRIFSLIEPYWGDGYELVDTPWAPYHDDSDWTLALKFKDDIVPDGKYSAIMTAHQGSSPLKLHLKCLTTDGKTTYQLIMGAGFLLSEDQFFSWVGGEPSKDGHHYLILAKHGDSYDIFYDGSILQSYGAPIGDVRSDATLQLFATDVGENVLLEKTSGTIEVLRVYDSALTRDECFKLYRELQTPW